MCVSSFRHWRLNAVLSFILILLLSGIMVTGVLPAHHALAAGTGYYVDSVNGNDNNDGQSPQTAWQSLNKVNGWTFQPGDHLFLLANSVWNGQQLAPQGSGSSGNPIIVDRYGSGNTPQINGQGNFRGTVYLHNQQYWEINNLEVTDHATTEGLRAGVYVLVDNGTTLNHIYLQNMLVHDILGFHDYNGVEDKKDTGGIIFAWSGSNSNSTFNDILVANSVVHDVVHSGIHMHAPGAGAGVYATNVVFRNNSAYNVSGDGIWTFGTQGALLDHNTVHDTSSDGATVPMWDWASNGDIFQYNEVYHTGVNNDGEAFDCDGGGNHNDIFQYNYSHDNPDGFFVWYNGTGCIVRYNISQNDGTGGGRSIFMGGTSTSATQVYNNTIYVSTGSGTHIIDNPYGSVSTNSLFTNNIIDNQNTASFTSNTANGPGTWDSNLFYGNHPSDEPNDAHKLTSDPRLVNPGGAGSGLGSASAYQLLAGSPAIGTGAVIANNGGQDYFGNPVSATSAPNRGADNGSNNGSIGNPGFESGNFSSWNPYGSAAVVNTNAHSGNYAAQIGASGGGAEQGIGGLSPNTTYTLTAWAEVATTGDPVYIGVKNFGGTETNQAITSTSYSQASVTFTTGGGSTNATIYLWKPNGGAGNVWVDDYALAVVGTTNYVTNPGFENADAGWSEWISSSSQSGDVHSITPDSITHPHGGSYSLTLYTNSKGFIQSTYQDIYNLPNGTYTLSAWVITSGGMSSIEVGAHKFDSSDTYARATVPTGLSYTWTQYTVSNIQVTNGMCEVYIYGVAPSGGTYWIGADDFSLVRS